MAWGKRVQGVDVNPHVLQHPLEEAEEISLHFSNSGRIGSSCRGWEGESVVWTSTEIPIVVTVNKVHAPVMKLFPASWRS
jgi:hypothetical protein